MVMLTTSDKTHDMEQLNRTNTCSRGILFLFKIIITGLDCFNAFTMITFLFLTIATKEKQVHKNENFHFMH
jgi:hypothetical protein